MKNFEELSKEAISEMQYERENDVKCRIKNVLHDIIGQQQCIARANKNIVRYREELASIKIKPLEI